MTKYENKSCGVKFSFDVPTTPEEFDALAGRAGACVEEANMNVIYRGVNADFRAEYLAALATKYNYERPKKQDGDKLNEDKTPKLINANSEGKDIDLIVAANSLTEAQQQEVADAVMASVGTDGKPLVYFDPAARERKPKADVIGKQDLELAVSILTGEEKQLKKMIKNIKAVAGVTVEITGDVEVDKLAVAKGIKAFRQAKAEEVKNALTA